MLTPQEAESHVFPKASFGGYNMLQVDAFLDSLIEDYRTLYQENASLKSKMKVLVEKVEEYRATEDAMRMTLHSAQKMADAMVKEGEAKKQAAIDQIAASVEEKSKAVRRGPGSDVHAVVFQLVDQVAHDVHVVRRDDIGLQGDLLDLPFLGVSDAGEEVQQAAGHVLLGLFQVQDDRALVPQVVGHFGGVFIPLRLDQHDL